MLEVIHVTQPYSPYLIAGLTEADALAFLRKQVGDDDYQRLVQQLDPQGLLLLALDVYRRERLLNLWADPRNPEERLIITLAHLGTPLALDSLVSPGPVEGVTPTLYPLGGGEWRLGEEEEDGPVFSGVGAQGAVAMALGWLGSAAEDVV